MATRKIKMSGIIGWDIMPDMLDAELEEAAGDDIEITMSSPGGDVFVGVDLYNSVRNYKRVYPESQMILNMGGEIASMGSYFASNPSFDLVTVEDNTSYMIHNPWSLASGDYRAMSKAADFLNRLTVMTSQSYTSRSKKTNSEIREMMDSETWLFGQEIIDMGFADELIKAERGDKNKASALASAEVRYKTAMVKVKEKELKESDIDRAVMMLNSISGINMKTGTYDSTIEIINEVWDKSEADKRWRAHTDAEESPNAKYAKAFLWYDSDNSENYGAYKLQIKDYVGGREVVNIRAVNNASARLNQTQGPSSDEKQKIQNIIDKYQSRWKKKTDTNSLSNNPAAGGNNKKETDIMDFTEVQAKFGTELAAIKKAGTDEEKSRMIANNNAIVELMNKDEYKRLPFVQERCIAGMAKGEDITDVKMSVNALLLDPKNAVQVENPADVSMVSDGTVSGEADTSADKKENNRARW